MTSLLGSSVSWIQACWKKRRRTPGWLHLIQLLSMHSLLPLGQWLCSQPIKDIVITPLPCLQRTDFKLLWLLEWRSRSVGIAKNMLPPYLRGKRNQMEEEALWEDVH